ncbi:polysaccharide deacetylase family protein [Sphingobium phenoxybenzoativorans]|uniref:Chitooligosaccharide deacetylase n=1 Tax=Sphingobium phenoxybenzoativorans TaxID=1592790 RepID=A0A975K725_9SPHN|nr:polysaccharide deacetylase family protein [Sphingobium phenoxybenzoativorans]QUT05687.1 polysaccharide deacetylase family protein [Sphingobium phenoxybenzoativorans]
MVRRRIARTLRSARAALGINVPVILMYHRIADESFDPWGLAVTPDRFRRQAEWLSRNRLVLPLPDFAHELQKGRLPARAVAITFDDGYACNGAMAAPILAAYNLASTVFLCPELITRGEECWWDDLERIILSSHSDRLDLDIGNGVQVVQLGPRDPGDRVWPTDSPAATARQKAYLSIWEKLLPLAAGAQRTVIAQLRDQVGISGEPRASHRLMDEAEITAAHRLGMAFGGHTLTHAALTARTDQELASEIQGSFAWCNMRNGAAPLSFAYPYGLLDDRAVDLAARSGFVCAVTTEQGRVRKDSSVFRLPRLRTENWTAVKLSRAMSKL